MCVFFHQLIHFVQFLYSAECNKKRLIHFSFPMKKCTAILLPCYLGRNVEMKMCGIECKFSVHQYNQKFAFRRLVCFVMVQHTLSRARSWVSLFQSYPISFKSHITESQPSLRSTSRTIRFKRKQVNTNGQSKCPILVVRSSKNIHSII